MAVGARPGGSCMHALAPELEFRMLRLEYRSFGLRVLVVEEPGAVGKFGLVPEFLLVTRAQSLAPRKSKRHLRRAVVLDVALTADVRAHLGARSIRVRIVGLRLVALAPAFYRR